MSRTNAHRPHLTDPERNEPHHDHRDGPCDLPTLEAYRKATPQERRKLRCTWEFRWHDGNKLIRYCGCRMCTGYWDRRWDRRRDRHDTKRQLRTGDI